VTPVPKSTDALRIVFLSSVSLSRSCSATRFVLRFVVAQAMIGVIVRVDGSRRLGSAVGISDRNVVRVVIPVPRLEAAES